MLNYNTVTPLLKSVLATLMTADVFTDFRLVGGTATYFMHKFVYFCPNYYEVNAKLRIQKN
jgi:hypothetical protein